MPERADNKPEKISLRSLLPSREGFLYMGVSLTDGFLTTIPTFLATRYLFPDNEGALAISLLLSTIAGQVGALEVIDRIRYRRSFFR